MDLYRVYLKKTGTMKYSIAFRAPLAGLALLSTIFVRCTDDAGGDADPPPDLRPISATAETLVETSNTFAIDLFRSIYEDEAADKNIFVSPLSVDIALNMTVNGASGETKTAIKETLGVTDLSDEAVNEAAKSLTEQLLAVDQQVDLAIANSIWYRDVFTLQPGFNSLIQDYYDGRIEGLDFDRPEAKETINQWVEDKTQGKIQNLIQAIKDTDVMFLVNALYFKANWQYQFDTDDTKDDQFQLADGTGVPVRMMSNESAKLRYLYQEDVQLIDIPYGNGQYSMTILLPYGDNSVASLIGGLTTREVTNWIEQADTLTTHLMMPKFKTEYKLELSQVLKGLGMELPFTEDATFDNFFEQNVGKKLYIDRVIHQTFIEVNEEGSEAAAATAVAIGVESVNLERPDLIRIDHPFVYFIREKHTQAILFAGTMMNPGN